MPNTITETAVVEYVGTWPSNAKRTNVACVRTGGVLDRVRCNVASKRPLDVYNDTFDDHI